VCTAEAQLATSRKKTLLEVDNKGSQCQRHSSCAPEKNLVDRLLDHTFVFDEEAEIRATTATALRQAATSPFGSEQISGLCVPADAATLCNAHLRLTH
jgi:hypothetical protein